MGRTVPKQDEAKAEVWRKSAVAWYVAHYAIGLSSAVITVFIAANAKLQFLQPLSATVLSAIAAGLAFLVTGLGANTRAKGFELAGRILESAIAEYEHDPKIPDSFLGDAVKKGVAALNDHK